MEFLFPRNVLANYCVMFNLTQKMMILNEGSTLLYITEANAARTAPSLASGALPSRRVAGRG